MVSGRPRIRPRLVRLTKMRPDHRRWSRCAIAHVEYWTGDTGACLARSFPQTADFKERLRNAIHLVQGVIELDPESQIPGLHRAVDASLSQDLLHLNFRTLRVVHAKYAGPISWIGRLHDFEGQGFEQGSKMSF